MNEIIPISAVSPLRQRLIDDMTVRRFGEETQEPAAICRYPNSVYDHEFAVIVAGTARPLQQALGGRMFVPETRHCLLRPCLEPGVQFARFAGPLSPSLWQLTARRAASASMGRPLQRRFCRLQLLARRPFR